MCDEFELKTSLVKRWNSCISAWKANYLHS